MPDTSVASAYSIPFHGVLYMASRQEGWEAKLEIWGCKRSLLVIYTTVRMLGSGIQPSNMQHGYSPSSQRSCCGRQKIIFKHLLD